MLEFKLGCYRNAPHEDTIGATAAEIPFHHRVAFSQSYYVLSGHIVIRKDIVFQVVPDLGDPCIWSSLSRWDGHHRWNADWTASFEVLA